MLSLPPVIFIFFSLNLFMSLCNHPLPVVNVLVSLISWDPLLKSLYGLSAFWRNRLLSVGPHFLFISSTHKFNAFFHIT